ncbi:hypothetical protein, unlikely [Trypanosoma brucei gambiense DAL972]|uniref:Uncharacterized protein n=1 Tax=Trypanosoma brucei gambiense (strain MHOM/CI/86/DAL972) TaxID=679716 RepID=C9ZW32_TRYB9|nr:hypothetical protein, unlikely [Trypanosoma brucei gambiense DAL972]CBH13621.1 hypothetical protein, unlikely [Trypanosoma brucei gambiense DAL972]|eukprot:XP_011775897.1 hypothetical protein, unlikely [Trypanosoma brucei gambiense DAL972]
MLSLLPDRGYTMEGISFNFLLSSDHLSICHPQIPFPPLLFCFNLSLLVRLFLYCMSVPQYLKKNLSVFFLPVFPPPALHICNALPPVAPTGMRVAFAFFFSVPFSFFN